LRQGRGSANRERGWISMSGASGARGWKEGLAQSGRKDVDNDRNRTKFRVFSDASGNRCKAERDDVGGGDRTSGPRAEGHLEKKAKKQARDNPSKNSYARHKFGKTQLAGILVDPEGKKKKRRGKNCKGIILKMGGFPCARQLNRKK